MARRSWSVKRDRQLPPVGAAYEFVQLSLTVGTAASLVGALVLGAEANHKPANAGNVAAVVQQVT